MLCGVQEHLHYSFNIAGCRHQAGRIDAKAAGDGGTDFREVEDFAFYLTGTDEFQGHSGEHGFVLEVEAK